MKVLSFDVGIKNLAFCLLNDKDYSIEDWGILNISVEPFCQHCNQKTGVQCDKTAKFMTPDNLCLCSSHKLLKSYKNIKMKNIPKIKNPTLEIGKKMVELLKEKSKFLEVDAVIIENQPALKNPTMKTIQMLLYSYFLINGITIQDSPIETIEMINARNKLKAYTGPPIVCIIKDKYKKTKFLGIEYCGQMINSNDKIDDKYKELFKNSKKKDDLSDAYLQGMYWFQK